MILALLLAAPAMATGASADIELVRPSLSPGGPVGVDSPWISAPGTVRVGTVLQYERDPLILYAFGKEAGVVVSERQALALGLSADLGRGASARLVLPAAAQWGSQVVDLAGDGFGLGDFQAGLRLVPPLEGPFRAGLRADLRLPTGRRQAWLGEATPRVDLGLLSGLNLGALEATFELGLELRGAVDTGLDLGLGTELQGGAGLRYLVWPDRVALTAGAVARRGVSDLRSGGVGPAELLTGMQLWPDPDLQVDLGLGKGLSQGYGTTELRALVGLTWIRRPPPPPPPTLMVDRVVELADAPEVEAPPPPASSPESSWEEGQLARVEQERIEIRDPIRFAWNTDRILPESLPTLRYVAELMAQDPTIGHLVVEGHASDEGSFGYNYELSIRRARAVWEQLVAGGVHPDRVSFRGMGEVEPARAGEDKQSLAANRRVELRIVYRRGPQDPPLPPGGTLRLPWNGDPVEVTEPAEPPPPPAPTPPAAGGGEGEDVAIPDLDPGASP